MSKYVKDLVSKDISRRLEGVSDALLVNVVGLDAGKAFALRRQLRTKNIQLLVVKNSLARRATEGTPLAAAFQDVDGTLAMVWGSEDFISLAKEITALDASPLFPAFEARGGVMDGEHLTAERVKEVSRWPNREEQIRLLLGQILSPGANLASQLLGPGGKLASQIEEKSKGAEDDSESPVDQESPGSAVAPEAPEAQEAEAAQEASVAQEAPVSQEVPVAQETPGGEASSEAKEPTTEAS